MFCRVCGLKQLDPPWGSDEGSPTYEICSCCGVEFGYEDSSIAGIKKFREQWVQSGKKWFDPKEKPDDWSFLKQFNNIQEKFK